MPVQVEKFDPNFKITPQIKKAGLSFYDPENAPFRVYGVKKEEGRYCRLPDAVAATVSAGVHNLCHATAGGCVRFRTNSAKIAVTAQTGPVKMPLCAFTGSAGFDLYADAQFRGTYIPPYDIADHYEGTLDLGSRAWRDITINLPLYSSVSQLLIGLEEDAGIEASAPYALSKPVVYYGSSITMGGCASRPGMSYEAIVSRKLNIEYVNLGFSGSAMGESAIASYISQLEMAAFVYDYDYNAPTVEHLKATHEPMFQRIRQAHPQLPILMMGRPHFAMKPEQAARLEVIRTTYENARAAGDEKVWMLGGKKLTALCRDEGTVDNCHPNDLGFASMAMAVAPVLKEMLKL